MTLDVSFARSFETVQLRRTSLVGCRQRTSHGPSPVLFRQRSTISRAEQGQGGEKDEDGTADKAGNKLSETIRRKHQEIQQVLDSLGLEEVDERLRVATSIPATPSYRFASLVQEIRTRQGRPALLLEVSRRQCGVECTSANVTELAEFYKTSGADAIVVLTDQSPNGLGDLFATCRALQSVPVLQRDWFLHPLQIVEAKQAGAAGVLGTITCVLGKGAPTMSSFAAAIGLDCPVEVVNKAELSAMEAAGVPLYALNVAVSLAIPIPGFRSDISSALARDMPFGALSMVGVTDMNEALAAASAGADALLIKEECLVALSKAEAPVDRFLHDLKDALIGD
eukprot:jgi/Botrbrau1/7164/Bobra.0143s0034.1